MTFGPIAEAPGGLRSRSPADLSTAIRPSQSQALESAVYPRPLKPFALALAVTAALSACKKEEASAPVAVAPATETPALSIDMTKLPPLAQFNIADLNPDSPVWDLWSVSVAGGQPTLVRHDAAWGGYSPDGKQLAYLAPMDPNNFTGGALWVAPADGGKARALVHSVGLSWMRWSPDGTRISYSDLGSIYVLNVATGATTQVAEGGNAEWFDDHTLIVGNPTN